MTGPNRPADHNRQIITSGTSHLQGPAAMDSLLSRGYLHTKAAVDDRRRSGSSTCRWFPGAGGRGFMRLYSEDRERGGQGREADEEALINSLEYRLKVLFIQLNDW